MPGCTGHKNCANCLPYALQWRTNLLADLTTTAGTRTHLQPALFTEGAAA
jgi:hypothetical protein